MSKRKPLTADKLIKNIQRICDENNADPKNIVIMFRSTRDCDQECVTHIEEDLFDSETNNSLESIMLFNDPREL